MILEITGNNVPHAFSEALWKMRSGVFKEEDSRNGPVYTVPYPTLLTINDPLQRVLTHPIRDANPFFHVMEFVWMMAGSNDAVWLSQFNKRMLEYADDGVLGGAYGHRWRYPTDQIKAVISLLTTDPGTRQAVISMWDPVRDGAGVRTSDRPCNTHIYFRMEGEELDMTVCNRSNDLIWGMLGANAVHMTFLHELISYATGIPIGRYQVFTNNLHIYKNAPRLEEMLLDTTDYDIYREIGAKPFPLLRPEENWEQLRADCENIVLGNMADLKTLWAIQVAYPMWHAYLNKGVRDEWIRQIKAHDWGIACEEWAARRSGARKSREGELQSQTIPHGGSDTRRDSRGAHGGGGNSMSYLDGWASEQGPFNPGPIPRFPGESHGGQPVPSEEGQPGLEEYLRSDRADLSDLPIAPAAPHNS